MDHQAGTIADAEGVRFICSCGMTTLSRTAMVAHLRAMHALSRTARETVCDTIRECE